MDFKHELLALGNTVGKLFYWELTADDPAKMKSVKIVPYSPKSSALFLEPTTLPTTSVFLLYAK